MNWRAVTALLALAVAVAFGRVELNRTWGTSHDTYYYSKVTDKVRSVVGPHCHPYTIVKESNSYQTPTSVAAIHFSAHDVPPELYAYWKNMKRPAEMRSNTELCEQVYNATKPLFDLNGCRSKQTMHPSAPRCQPKYIEWACVSSAVPMSSNRKNNFVLPEADHSTSFDPPTPWLLTRRNAYVNYCGSMIGKCGAITGTTACGAGGSKIKKDALAFGNVCAIWDAPLIKDYEGPDFINPKTTHTVSECIHHNLANWTTDGSHVFHVDRVFVVSQLDDTHVYHIHAEVFPKIAYHLQFLVDNPDVKIMMGCFSHKNPWFVRKALGFLQLTMEPMMKLLGLSMDRLVVNKHVFAKEVYYPMDSGCQDPVHNTWRLLAMRNVFLRNLGIYDKYSGVSFTPVPTIQARVAAQHNEETKTSLASAFKTNPNDHRPIMILISRSISGKSRQRMDMRRQWSPEFTLTVFNQLQASFPQFQVVLFSDKDEAMMGCFECQVKLFASADVAIGVHGAGLGMMLYMKPNSAVVEISAFSNDGRTIPGGGPFNRMSVLLSHNYLTHIPIPSKFTMEKHFTATFDVPDLVMNIRTFLEAINFIV